MNNPTWSSDAIRITEAVCVDVKAAPASVVLGLFIGNGELATDIAMDAENAERIAHALLDGAKQARA
jgi:hypothetical protein